MEDNFLDMALYERAVELFDERFNAYLEAVGDRRVQFKCEKANM